MAVGSSRIFKLTNVTVVKKMMNNGILCRFYYDICLLSTKNFIVTHYLCWIIGTHVIDDMLYFHYYSDKFEWLCRCVPCPILLKVLAAATVVVAVATADNISTFFFHSMLFLLIRITATCEQTCTFNVKIKWVTDFMGECNLIRFFSLPTLKYSYNFHFCRRLASISNSISYTENP